MEVNRRKWWIISLAGTVGFFFAIAPVLDPYIVIEIGSGFTLKINDIIMLFLTMLCFSKSYRFERKTGFLCMWLLGLGIIGIFGNLVSNTDMANSFKNLIVWLIYAVCLTYLWKTPCRDKFFQWIEIIAIIASILVILQFVSGYVGMAMWDGRIPGLALGKYDGFVVYMCVVAFCYPLFAKTSQSYWYVVALTFVLGSNLLVQYFISLSYRLLLKADRKVYVESIVQLIVVVLNLVLVLITINIYRDILVVKLISAIVFLIQPIAFATYVNKNYHLDRHAPIDNTSIKQRWDGFGQNLAFFIHSNTDIVVLTIFKNLTSVSVYSIYNMIVMALKNLVISISSAISPSIGNVLAKGEKDKINEAFELYEFGLYYVATIMFSCCLVLILPFVKVYTTNITDANYLQPVFAVLLVLAEFVYCIRDPYVAVAYASGKFRETSKYAIIEALINIVISVILVQSLGLAGIAIGTLIAMVYRMIAHVIYLQKNILFRSLKHFVKKMLVFTFSGSCVVLLARFLKVDRCINMGQWLVNAVIVGIGSVLVITLISSIFFKSTVKKLVISKIKK